MGLKYQLEWDKVQQPQTHCGHALFFGTNHFTKIFYFCVHSGALDLIYPGTSFYEHILWMHLEKNRTYECTLIFRTTQKINVVKVRFTMRYSSKKLSHEKIISTACNVWRQIACSFVVKSGNVWLLVKKVLKSRHFLNLARGSLGKKVHECSLLFFALNLQPGCTFDVILTSSIQYEKFLSTLGQQLLVMVNYACGYHQLKTGNYFE